MATYSPMSSLNGPRDHLDRLVADILNDDADEYPVGSNNQKGVVKTNASYKDGIQDQGKALSDNLPHCFLKNGRFSSGSSSNGDSGFDGGIGSGSLSTPSSSRRTTSSSDNFSTPSVMSTTSDGLSPSSPTSEKISSNDHHSISDITLQISPLTVEEIGFNSLKNAPLNENVDQLFNSLMAKPAPINNVQNDSICMNHANLSSGLDVMVAPGRCDTKGNDLFHEPLVSFESLISPTNVPTDMLTYERSNEVHSIFDKAGDAMANSRTFLLPITTNGLQTKATGSSIHSSSRSSPTSSISGCSAAVIFGTNRSQTESLNFKGCDSQNDKYKQSIDTGNVIPSSANTNLPPQLVEQYQRTPKISSPDNFSQGIRPEKENPLDNQVVALQQAVALLQMGNIFETNSKIDNEPTMNNMPSNNVLRHNGRDSSKVLGGETRVELSGNTHEERHEPLLEGSFVTPNYLGSSNIQTNNHPTNVLSNQTKFSENMQQSNIPQGATSNSQESIFRQNDVKANADNGVLNSALMENLTALVKLDQLTSEKQQTRLELPHMYHNMSVGAGGDVKHAHNESHELFQRNTNTSGYQGRENFSQYQRYNSQQGNYQHQNQSNILASPDQSALLQLAAMTAASEQQQSSRPSSQVSSSRGMNSLGSSTFGMPGHQNVTSGIIERHRNMQVGGRGSPSFGQYPIDSMSLNHDNMRYFRGENVSIGKYGNNMFGGSQNGSTSGHITNVLRNMEQNKGYPGNFPPFFNGAPFDAPIQATGGFASPGSNNIIPSSTTTDLANSEGSQMQIRCKFGQLGQGRGQFNAPHGFCLGGRDEEIVVADTHNHRIQVFDKNGNFRYMFGSPGKEEGCLWYPRKVVVMKNTTGNFVVCDRGCERSRMQIFSPQGHFIRRIAIRFIDIVAGLAVQCWGDGHIVAVDSVTPTIFVLAEDGRLIKYHECSEFMNEPSDIAVFGREYYICDFKGHSVVVVNEEGQFIRRIGSERVTCFPNGIDISDAGDVLIGDSHGNQFHVAVYDKDAQLVSQFVCPNVKVSRCCGLKITMEGYIVTLAKNNHHVLVLNTLYVS